MGSSSGDSIMAWRRKTLPRQARQSMRSNAGSFSREITPATKLRIEEISGRVLCSALLHSHRLITLKRKTKLSSRITNETQHGMKSDNIYIFWGHLLSVLVWIHYKGRMRRAKLMDYDVSLYTVMRGKSLCMRTNIPRLILRCVEYQPWQIILTFNRFFHKTIN